MILYTGYREYLPGYTYGTGFRVAITPFKTMALPNQYSMAVSPGFETNIAMKMVGTSMSDKMIVTCDNCRNIPFWTMPGWKRRLVSLEGREFFIRAANTIVYDVEVGYHSNRQDEEEGQERSRHRVLSSMQRESSAINFEQQFTGGDESPIPHNSGSLEEDSVDYHLAFGLDGSKRSWRVGVFHSLKDSVKRVGVKAVTSVLALAWLIRHGIVVPNLVVVA